MSNSTSAKSADHGADSPKNGGESTDPKASDTKLQDTADAQASKDESAPNGTASASAAKSDSSTDAQEKSETLKGEAAKDGATGKDGTHSRTEADAKPASQSDERSPPPARADGEPTAEAAEPAKAAENAEAEDDSTQSGPADDDDAADTLPEAPDAAEEEETLDLRALFASSESEFASPSDTFELARGAKSTSSQGAARGGDDGEPPLDLPPDGVSAEADDSPFRRGGARTNALADTRDDAAANSETFGANANDDPLADAVQSALRSVYGEHSGADEYRVGGDDSEKANGGPVLQWAGTGADLGAHEPAGAQAERSANVFDPPDRENAIDEETTEAVLSYLYEHMGEDDTASPAAAGQAGGAAGHARDDDWRSAEQWLDSAMPARGHDGAAHTADAAAPYRSELDPASVDSGARHNPPEDLAPPPASAGDFAAPMDLSLDSSEASGKLLGAAGLGLIGGIAVAGVAAVFVFNSFVTQQGPDAPVERTEARLSDTAQSLTPAGAAETATDAADKDSARLGETDNTSSAPSRTAAVATPETGVTAASGAASEQAIPQTSSTAQPQISAGSVTGRSDQAIPLDLTVAESDGESFVRIDGLPEGVRLSAGVDTGNGSWLLSAGRANGLSLSAPDSYSGEFTLEARLLADDARTPISETTSFQVSVAAPPARQPAEVQTTALSTDAAGAGEEASGPVGRATRLLRQGDVRSAREILRVEAQGGNAEAALALGKSYDPMTFTPDSPANAAPDATEAFRWYQKAVELGAPEGDRRITELKTWLLQ